MAETTRGTQSAAQPDPPIHDAPPDAKSREPSLHVLKKLPVTTGIDIAVFIRNTWGATSNLSSVQRGTGIDTEKLPHTQGLMGVVTQAPRGARSHRQVCSLPPRPHRRPTCPVLV